MTSEKPTAESILQSIPEPELSTPRRAPAPVHLWNPPVSGEMDMRIARDGTWIHEGTAITRKPLVQLFAGILRFDEDQRYYLVTPVERWAIQVEDAPFVAVSLEVEGEGEHQVLRFTTNLDDSVEAGPDNPIRVVVDPDTQEPSPYVLLRTNLEALINRNVFYDLAERAVEHKVDGKSRFGLWSHGTFFPIDGTSAAS
ncbi:DUF1285 domain-containing protein [Pseudomonas saliphila]|uniref:DUF1285 domain-containing protein n=1 Tax=Pseudomonas saliphila TaxID=2586906 RepID=UPI001238F8AA|nr:DUF1285 domain-containing protein [Pseudomonas saliphila]